MTGFTVAADWVLPVDQVPIEKGFVRVNRAGYIEAVGRQADLSADSQNTASTADSHTQTLLTPGLINTHAHLELSYDALVQPPCFLKKEDDKIDFADWLLNVVRLGRQPEHASLDAKQARIEAGIRAMLQTGTTCVNDISGDGASLHALHAAQLRGRVSVEFFHPALQPDETRLTHLMEQLKALSLHAQVYPRVSLGLSPHSPFNVSPQAWQWVLLAWKNEWGETPWVHTHLAESLDETAWLLGQTSGLNRLHQTLLGQTFLPEHSGLSPVQYLQRFGLLQPQLVVAHGVFTDQTDRLALAQACVGLAHCPRSNQALHGQTLNAAHWQQDAPTLALGLGTDSLLSTPNLDLREEARTAMRLHGWTAAQALMHITLEGARVMGLERETGSLSQGKGADMVLWHVATAEAATPEAGVLSPATECFTVWKHGNPTVIREADH